MRMIGVAALALLMTAGAASAQEDLDGSFPGDAGITFEALHKAVSADFLDPRSAQYKGMSLQKTMGGEADICGWVNVKNSAGGYEPFNPFVLTLSDQKPYVATEWTRYPEMKNLTLNLFKGAGCLEALGLPPPEAPKP